jgi:uncharacterized protein YjiS (DUF1127 family)
MNNTIQSARHLNVSPTHKASTVSGLGLFTAWLARVKLARTVRSERRALEKLSDHALQDLGITRAEAELESKRASYDLPERYSIFIAPRLSAIHTLS